MLCDRPIMPVLPCLDLESSRHFYNHKLGLRAIGALSPTSFVFEAGKGTKLELEQRENWTKVERTALTFEVDDIEREVSDLEHRGIRFEDYDLPNLKTAHHIAQIEGVKAAWFKDPDGNMLCVHQRIH